MAVNACWGWRGRVGRTENAHGERVDETGILPEIKEYCRGRVCLILFDSNSRTSESVRHARRALTRELQKIKAEVRIIDLPAAGNCNGPDDYRGAHGDAAMTALLATAMAAKDEVKAQLAGALTLLRTHPEWSGVLA